MRSFLWDLIGRQKITFQKTCFHDDNFFRIFPRIIECDKPQETIYKRPEAFLTITVELMTAFFKGFKRLLKTQVFEKRQPFQ